MTIGAHAPSRWGACADRQKVRFRIYIGKEKSINGSFSCEDRYMQSQKQSGG